jgi:uncharacterized membrane protein YebE (DUF533 family)
MKKAISIIILALGGMAYRQYLSYQECKKQSHQAALFAYPNDPAHPEYADKREQMETNFIKTTCHKFGPNLGT